MEQAKLLQIFLLGPPEVVWQGKALKFSRRIQRAMLFYLAIEGKVSREALQELFWPEENYADHSNANLRVNLARLRKELPSDTILLVNKDTVWLDPNLVAVDGVEFLNLVDQPLRFVARSQWNRLPDSFVAQLRRAAELWRSAAFLDGFSIAKDNPSLEHWLENTTWRFQETHLRVLRSLATHCAGAGDLDAAIQWTQAALEIDPWQEEQQRHLIEWSQALNRSNAVLNMMFSLHDQYERENEPMPEELSALMHSVRRQITSNQIHTESRDWPGRLLVQAPLVGLQQELLTLQSAFRRGGLVVVRGETGFGKTRLAYELARSLQPGPRLLVMNCIQGEERLPFQPWIDALRRTIKQDEWEALASPWLQPMAALLPELQVAGKVQPAAADASSPAQRSRLYEGLRQLLLLVSRSQRVLVVIDSAQWCDEDTLAAMSYLFERQFFNEHGLLLILERPQSRPPCLQTFIDRHQRSALFSTIHMPALTVEETQMLAFQVLDEHIALPVAYNLIAATGGVPLFLLETLFALMEFDSLAEQDLTVERLPVGAGIHHFLTAQINRLGLQERQVLEAAVAIGHEFRLSLLEAVCRLEAHSVGQHLDQLERAGLIRPQPERLEPVYCFVYGQIRQIMPWLMGTSRHRMLHLRVARVLEQQPEDGSEHHRQIAQQYEAAGEILPAMRHWVTAGLKAFAQLHAMQAEQAFFNAERLLRRDPQHVPDILINQLYSAWGEIAYQKNDAGRLEEISQFLLQTAQDRHSELLLGNGLCGTAMVRSMRKESAAAMELFQQAAYHLSRLDDPVALANCYRRQGRHLLEENRFREGRSLSESALRLVDGIDQVDANGLRAVIQYQLGIIFILIGQPLDAQKMANQLFVQVEHYPSIMYGHWLECVARFFLGEFDISLEHHRLAKTLAVRNQHFRLLGRLLYYQLSAELNLGQVDRAWSQMPEVLAFAEEYHMPEVFTYAQLAKGDVYRLLGDLDSARQAYREGIENGGAGWETLLCRQQLGLVTALGGDAQQGLADVEETLHVAQQANLEVVCVPGWINQAIILAQMGRYQAACAVLDEHAAAFQQRGYAFFAMIHSWIHGRAALHDHEHEQAAQLAERAAQAARRMGAPHWEMHALWLLKQCGRLNAGQQARVKELLLLTDHRARHPELRHLVEPFLQRTRAAMLSDNERVA